MIARLFEIRPWFAGVYYGWYVVAACNGIAFVTWGVTIFNQGVFLGYFVTAHGWSPATLSVGPLLFHVAAGLAGVPVGRILDVRGPRVVLLLGAALVALGMVGFGLVGEAWHTFFVFVLLGCGFACIHTITLGKIVTRWFVRARARAMAAATFGAGIGGALLVPLCAAVIERSGALVAGSVLAGITLAMIVPLALWVIKDGPEVIGQKPDGGKEARSTVAEAAARQTDERIWSVPEAMRTVAFWGLSSCLAAGMLAQGCYLVHQVIFLQESLGLIGAAWVVTVTTLMGMAGRVGFMLIGDRFAPRVWAALMLALQGVSFLILAAGTTELHLVLGSALFGLTMGVLVVIQPVSTASVFGQLSFGRIFGPIYLAIRVGAAIGPVFAGVLVAMTGGYQTSWFALAGLLGLASLGIYWAMSPLRR